MKKVTTQKIANSLQLSRNTVSRALNNQSGISDETRQTVLETARQMGYNFDADNSPAPAVQKQPPAQNRRMALIATDFTLELQSFFGVIVNRLKHDLRLTHTQMDYFAVTPEMRKQGILPNGLNSKLYQGIFVLSFISNDYIQKVIDLGIPTVLIDHHDPSLAVDSILTENIDGTRIAIDHLASLGYKHFGFIGDVSFSPSYQERYIGFQTAIGQHAELTAAPEHIITTAAEAYPNQLFAAMKILRTMPDVWFTVNNGYASMLMTFLQGSGYNVPEDIGIFSFDDTDVAQVTNPKLSVIATDLEQMADVAWTRLQAIMASESHQQIYLRLIPKVIERASVRERN